MNNVILFGLKNAGKTTLGKKIALLQNKQFIDTDALIEKIFAKENLYVMTCRNIYRIFGKHYFENIEQKAIAELIKNPPNNSVIALGGSSLLKERNRKILTTGKPVYLKITFFEFFRRALKNPPVFIDINKPLIEIFFLLKKFFEERNDVYSRLVTKFLPDIDIRQH